jgi:hypothetical protein
VADHENRDRADNRFLNLRSTTTTNNQGNTVREREKFLLPKGVQISHSRAGKKDRYQAKIRIDGRMCALGTFDTPEEAHAAYMRAAREHFGEFALGEHFQQPRVGCECGAISSSLIGANNE